VIAAKGVNKIEALLTRIAEDETLPKLAKELFAQYRQDYARLQVAIEKIEAKLMAWHKHNALSRRLVKTPSIGPIGASLLVMKGRSACFPIRSRFFGMDRSDPEGSLHRRKDPARRDHARRRPGVAQRAGGRRDCGDPAGPARKRRFALTGRAPQAQSAQGSRRGARPQAARIVWKLMTAGGHYDPTHASAPGAVSEGRCATLHGAPRKRPSLTAGVLIGA
jgi:transposase